MPIICLVFHNRDGATATPATCSFIHLRESKDLRASTPRVWHTTKLDEKCCGPFQIASRLTNLACQARSTLKLSLVRFILHSTCDWSIHYLRGTFGLSFSWRALQMKNWNLSMLDLVRIGADTLRESKVAVAIPVWEPYPHPIKIPIPVIMAPKYKGHALGIVGTHVDICYWWRGK
jgi:hypothetical protein